MNEGPTLSVSPLAFLLLVGLLSPSAAIALRLPFAGAAEEGVLPPVAFAGGVSAGSSLGLSFLVGAKTGDIPISSLSKST